MKNDGFIVIEGIHKNPNKIDTLDEQTKVIHGPYNKEEADKVAKGLIQKNIDNFYHRAWVVNKDIEIKEDSTKVRPKLSELKRLFGCNEKLIEKTLLHDNDIQAISSTFNEAKGSMFLGRGYSYPIALEGA